MIRDSTLINLTTDSQVCSLERKKINITPDSHGNAIQLTHEMRTIHYYFI